MRKHNAKKETLKSVKETYAKYKSLAQEFIFKLQHPVSRQVLSVEAADVQGKLNGIEFSALLVQLRACSEASTWATGKSLKTAWKTCKRGDWLLWLCGKMADKPGWPTRKEVVLATCDCAKLALKRVKAGEDRPCKCIEVLRAWAAGKATKDDVRLARSDADAAAYAAASYTAYAPASYTAAYAAYAAASYTAAYAAAFLRKRARAKTLKKCADLVRDRLSIPGGR